MTTLQKRLAELRELASAFRCNPDACTCNKFTVRGCTIARAILALLPVVEALESAPGIRSTCVSVHRSEHERVVDAYHACERALIKTETKETKA